ncbi:Prolyl-tRNA_synthetase [Hexamita inflata]|uniref:proline--tRNA ligase n=1 Tax=Hexamita inflata TaxID=28002 RepID=A0AA86UU07_9EUKA|nr:Prolyl-tRNA synthetase [Hexamita inflata]
MSNQNENKKDSKQAKAAIRAGDVTFQLHKTAETFSDWYDAVMDAAEIVDRRYPVKGCPVLRPYGFFMHNAIMREVEDRYAEVGVEQALFPTVIPESFLNKEADHIKGFGAECFWIDRAGNDKLEEPLALRPTSETAIYYMFNKWVRSFRDLPLKVHQTCTVFRYETKNTKPLIRVREIPWNEAHTCHATKVEALDMMNTYWKVCMKIFEQELCFTGKVLQRAPWDKFAGAEHTEVLDVIMPCGRVLQTAGIHYLGQKFAKVFDINFLDQNNTKQLAEMTCCGVSTRVLACALAIHGDDKGLILPPLISQFQVVLIPCGGKKEAEVYAPLQEMQTRLRNMKIRCTIDDSKQSMGEKLFYWEMKGAPLRIELGPRDLETQQFVLVARDLGKDGKKTCPIADLEKVIAQELEAFKDRLRAKAMASHKDHITIARTLDEIQEVITKKGGFAQIPFFTMEAGAKEAEEVIKEKCGGAEIRGFWPEEKCEGEICAVTGKPATVWAYVARAY